jgi:uncharacterized membrane protein (DUF4010 family)
MDTLELFQRLSLSLAIGLLIGLERGWQAREEPEGERAAGLRTLALTGVLGGVWAAVARQLGPGGGLALGLAFAVAGGTLVLFRYRETSHEGTFGATTAMAGLVAFALGAFAVLGDMSAAAAAGVAVTGLLALKNVLHGWLRQLTWVELRSGLMLLAMTFLALPVLPNRTLDPLGAVNPFEIWLLTVMLAVISFAGYIAIKLTGERRGIVLTGLAGGLASSTAVTLTLARLGRERDDRPDLLAGGTLIAGATMMLRVLVLAGIVETAMLARLALPLGLAGVAMAGLGLLLIRRVEAAGVEGTELTLANPLDLAAVLKFGALLTSVGVLARLATRFAGSAGAYALAALSGLADVDAITLSMARLAGSTLDMGTAAGAVLTAVAVNTVAKAVLGWWAGGPSFGLRLAVAAAVALAAGGLGLAVGSVPLDRLPAPA